MTRRQTLVLVATSAAAVMIGMDFNGAAAVVTQIEGSFDSDLTTTQWFLTLYALIFGMSIVTGGKLGDTLGHRSVLLIGLGVFGVASVVVAIAPEIWLALVFRGIQGAGGALVWPSIVAIAFNAVPSDKSSLAVGVVLGAAGLGNVIGPLVAGTVAELSTWRWLFVINIPVVIAVTAMALAFIPAGARSEGRNPDLPGIASLSVALFALMFALDVGASWGYLSFGVIALLLVAIVGFIAFTRIEPRSPDPLVPPDLLRDSGFISALLANGLLVPVWFSSFLYIPQYMQKTLGHGPLTAAAALLPAMATFAVLSPLAGRFYGALGAQTLLRLGYSAIVLSALNFAIVQPDWDYWGLLPGILLLGTGAGLTISTAGTAAVAAVDKDHSGSAGGLSFMFHLVFGAVGVSLGTALFAAVATTSALGDEFADGMHAVFLFAGAVAIVGVVNTFFVGSRQAATAG